MLPPLPTRPLRQPPRILDRHPLPVLPASEDPLLLLPDPEQPAPVAGTRPQFLVRLAHGVPHALELQGACRALFGAVELPRAVDGPVPEVAGPAEAEGARGEWVVEEVAD